MQFGKGAYDQVVVLGITRPPHTLARSWPP